ncbi:MAG: hypothetical protein EOO44_08555 [Flavobacterium sp.]|nr:MAG: hypothetical protein EOO44_08555 [Flavobacterium sp.]
MAKKKYLELITNTFEKFQPIADLTEQKYKFQEEILIAFTAFKIKKPSLTKTKFLKNCNIAVEALNDFIEDIIDTYSENENIPSIIPLLGSAMKNPSLAIDYDTFCVNLTPLLPNATTKLCINDIEFIQSVFRNINLSTSQQSEFLNLTESPNLSDTTAVTKIIYLKELGILDLLLEQNCFKTSVRNLAVVLSKITKEKTHTLQPILNPLLHPDSTAQKNNPYEKDNSKKAEKVNQVRNELNDLGVKLK